jgi:FkbM family methyltransferase
MQIFKILKGIYNHPFNSNNKIGGLLRFFKWQVSCRLSPYPIIYPYTENSKLIICKGQAGSTGNLYCGLFEYNDMGFLLHFLRPQDLFVDIGANVGVYTILASAEIKAKTIAVEPVPSTFKSLRNNIFINQMQDRVSSMNIGLGSKKGILKFTKSLDTVNHVATENEKDTIDVEVNSLDSILMEDIPSLLKIDVEGFETEVLSGAKKTLENDKLKAIILELNGSGDRYGYDDNLIHENLIQNGFRPFDYNPETRKLTEIESFGSHNTIYIRDRDFVEKRILETKKIKIGVTEQWL